MQYHEIHPVNPQARLISQAVAVIRRGGIIAYPTDSSYALGCCIGDKAAMEKICRIRQIDSNHNFTLMCRDLSDISTYARYENSDFRLIKSLTPGPYTFIFNATREVPRRLQNPRRKTIGIRVPDHPITLALLEALGEPLMSVTLIMPGEDMPLTDPQDIRDKLANQLDVIIDGGFCGHLPTTVIDFTGELPDIKRKGKGDSEFLSIH
jgi:tRNA threonylcarbamoyl adenosine modification protein (Sua5/YciO/YrdC/YwlC family)